jgi:hypothetical protein
MLALIGVAVILLAIAGCGGSGGDDSGSSSADTAQNGAYGDVCIAVAEIEALIGRLREYDPDAVAALSETIESLDDIRKSVTEIEEEYSKLDQADRAKVEASVSEFMATFVDKGLALSDDIASAAGDPDSAKQIKRATAKAADAMQASFDEAFGPLGCQT